MKRTIIILVSILGFVVLARADLSVGNGGGATNITSTSAWLRSSVTATGAANPYLFSFYATSNHSTNLTWTHTNVFGESTVGVYSAQATALAPDTLHYYRTYATNSTATSWASATFTFRTLSTTSAPAPSTMSVAVDTNGVLKAPTNLWWTNRVDIAAAVSNLILTGMPVYVETDPVWCAASNQVQTGIMALEGATNALDGRMDTVEGWGDHATNGYATGTPVYVESDPVWLSEKSGYATGTPVYAETDPVWENEKAGYATGTPVYAETDPVWENEKAGYATGTPVYAESDPVWSAARTNYDEATNTLHNRLTALDAASTGAVAVLQGATNTLDGRVTALEGIDGGTSWSAYPAVQGIEIAGNVLSNVMQITPATNFLVLDESFTNDVFTAGTWTNTAGEWGWTSDQIISLINSTCSNLTASIVSGQTYSITVGAGYGLFRELYGTNNVTITLHCGGESITLTNATYGWHNTTHSITASASSGIGFSSTNEYPGIAIVTDMKVRNVTSSNSVAIPRLESDLVTLGGETRTNWPGEYDSNTAFQGYTATVDPGAGETVTVAYAHGSLVKIVATNGLTTLTFDNAAYPTAGVSRVAINLWAGTNGIGFDSLTITNETAPTIPTNAWKGLMFRRIEGGLWYGREY